MSDFDRQNTWLSLQPVTGVKFDDGTTQTSADVEGTVVKSTGEGGGTKFLREDGDGSCSWQATGSATEYGEMNFLETEIDIPTQSSISDRTALTSGDWHDLAASSTWEGAHALICRITMGWGSTPFTHSIHFRTNASGNDIEVAKGATARWGGHTGIVIVPVHTDGSAQWKWEGSGTWGSNQSYFDLAVIGHMDGNLSSSPEGTAVKSTTNGNEAATKFLRADGDGTCSWQATGSATKFVLDWTSSPGSVSTANGSTHTITHDLGTEELFVQIWAKRDSDGMITQIDTMGHVNAQWTSGAQVTGVTTTEITIQTGASGYMIMASTGYSLGFQDWADSEMKVVVLG